MPTLCWSSVYVTASIAVGMTHVFVDIAHSRRIVCWIWTLSPRLYYLAIIPRRPCFNSSQHIYEPEYRPPLLWSNVRQRAFSNNYLLSPNLVPGAGSHTNWKRSQISTNGHF